VPSLTRDSLWSLERYSRERSAFRAQVIAHKRDRTVHVGGHLTLIFEDELTIRYQVQEMLRAERIFEEEGIQGELDAYGPLVPDGTNLKATMMIEYEDVAERARALALLKGIEDSVWMRVGDGEAIRAIADEDLERENDEKTSAVHFLRFEFPPAAIAGLRAGAALSIGVDHDHYRHAVDPLPANIRDALVRDFA